jgi:hypothetical protein
LSFPVFKCNFAIGEFILAAIMLAALQLFAAFFLTLFGLAQLFDTHDSMQHLVGALLAGFGLTFLSLMALKLRK